MRVTTDWLRDWVAVDDDAEKTAESLTLAGLEVDAVEPAAAPLPEIVVARVRAVAAHPNADRLSVCRVFDGERELDVVCGAPNVRPDINVPLAPVGATLPSGMKIRRAKIRGTESNGMLCSARELELTDDADGLLVLDDTAVPGTPLEDHLKLGDSIIDVDLTANRGDCFSILGIARELAARGDGRLQGPSQQPVAPATEAVRQSRLGSPADCSRFATRVIEGIDTTARTPDWMKERLRRVGMRPISPVVDVTNYVMWELGQPLHAYAGARIAGDLVARLAAPGETLTLLDGSEIDLAPDVLVIADTDGPVGLAGIMGGESSAIDAATADIVLEAAFFSPSAIQGRARRYGLHTDASVRFERGVDPEGQVRAIERATALLASIAGGRAGPVFVAEDRSRLPIAPTVTLRHARIEKVLGQPVDRADVERWLTRLGMQVQAVEGGWTVVPPSHRFDIGIEEDLIEEVGRMLGYDAIVAMPGTSRITLGKATESRIEADEIADTLVARGFDEIISYSFIAPSTGTESPGTEPDPLQLANPISTDLSVMRRSLVPGLVRTAQQNLSRQRERCRLFEIGTVFAAAGDGIAERTMVAGLAAGAALPEHWDTPERVADYYDIKSEIVALFAAAGTAGRLSFRAAEHPVLNPSSATAVLLDGDVVGHVGALHPKIEREFDLRKRAVAFEIDVAHAFIAAVPRYHGFPRFPYVRRDLAVVVSESTTAGELTELLNDELGDRLTRIVVFDEYRGKALESGHKSIGLGLILQDASRTLTDADADRMLTGAMQRLERELGATIRT